MGWFGDLVDWFEDLAGQIGGGGAASSAGVGGVGSIRGHKGGWVTRDEPVHLKRGEYVLSPNEARRRRESLQPEAVGIPKRQLPEGTMANFFRERRASPEENRQALKDAGPVRWRDDNEEETPMKGQMRGVLERRGRRK